MVCTFEYLRHYACDRYKEIAAFSKEPPPFFTEITLTFQFIFHKKGLFQKFSLYDSLHTL
jgi:hypothetical protein